MMSPTHVLMAYKRVGGNIHAAGIAFGGVKKAENPKDARKALQETKVRLNCALKNLELLLKEPEPATPAPLLGGSTF